MNLSLHAIDVAIVIGYLLAVLGLGVWVGRGQKDTVDYFLGDRSLPTWAVLLSIVATETSTVTFLSIPGFAYVAQGGDMRFLQITFGYIVGRLLVVWILLPLYFQGEAFTAYEVLQRRFGRASRRATSLLFLVTRNLSDALRLFLTALALQVAVGLELPTCIIVMGAITVFYTFIGGVKSVVWNDCLQFFIYILGAAIALGTIVARLPDGWYQIARFGEEFEKFRVFDFEFSLTKPSMTFWAGLVGGMFLTAATHGTDQLMVQRYLTARSQRAASWALALSGVVVCAQFALFLLIGVALACFFNEFPPEVPFGPKDGDKVFSYFIVRHMNVGFVGLTLSAILAAAMSTLSGSLNSSSTAFINDLYLPLTKSEPSPERQLWISRISTAFFGALQVCIALASYYLGTNKNTVDSVLMIAGFALGPLLGLYFLAVFAKRVEQREALLGFCVGVAALSYIALETPLYGYWYACAGSGITFAAGLLLSYVLPSADGTNVTSSN